MKSFKTYRLLQSIKFLKFFSYRAISICILFFCWVGVLVLNPWQELYAKDFGIEGHTYKIIEEDMLKVIEQRLSKVDLEQLNNKMTEKAKAYIERPTAVSGITRVKETREFFYDPTYILEEDIKDHRGIIIHHKGTKVNPLNSVPLREALIFIDGDDQSQVELALSLRAKQQGKAKIILVKGSPLQLQRNHRKDKIWFYFDQSGYLTKKFGINQVPALVTQEGLALKVTLIGNISNIENIGNRS